MVECKKVSVIITTHNRLESLKEAVESVFEQTYKNVEIIIVDDCSDDGTDKYCKTLSNVKYIKINENEHKNASYARNLGLKIAKGEYIAFLDDDDKWLPTKIEKQVYAIEKSDVGMVYAPAIIDVNNGMYIEHGKVNQQLRGDLSKTSLYNIITSTSAMLFKKNILDNVKGFDEKLGCWQDTELIIRVSQVCKIDYVDEDLLIYREVFTDKQRISNNIDEFLKAVKYINNKHKEQIKKLSWFEKRSRWAMIWYDAAYRLAKKGENGKVRKYLFKAFISKPSIKNFGKFLLNYTWVKKAYKHAGDN